MAAPLQSVPYTPVDQYPTYSDEDVEIARRYAAGEPLSSILSTPAAPPPAPAEELPTNLPDVGAGGTTAAPPPGQPNPFTGGAQGAPSAPVQEAPPPPPPEIAGPAPAAPVGLPAPVVRPAPGRIGGAGGAQPPGPADWLTKEMQARGEAPEGELRRVDPLGTPELVNERGVRLETEKEGFKAMVEGGEAAIKRGQELGVKQAEADAADAARLAKNAEHQQRQANELAAMETDARKLFDDFEQMKLDKDPYWNGLGTGEQIVQAIAVGLGAMGALAGAPNVAWERIKMKTENALAVQAKEKEGKLRRAMGEFTLIDSARQRFGDENVARAVAREAAYRNNVAEIAKWNAVAQGPEQKAALDQMLAQANLELGQAEQQRRQAQDLYLLQRQAAGRVRPKQAPTGYVVPGYGVARTAEGAKQGRELVAAADESFRILAKLRQLREKGAKTGAFGVGSKEYHEANALRTQLVGQTAKIISGGGTIQQGERDMASDMVPDATSWRGDKFEANENAIRERAKAQIEAWKAQNILPEGETPSKEGGKR